MLQVCEPMNFNINKNLFKVKTAYVNTKINLMLMYHIKSGTKNNYG